MTEDKETIGTILVPHDGTEMSDKALKKAELLSRASGSQIIVIHVIDDRFINFRNFRPVTSTGEVLSIFNCAIISLNPFFGLPSWGW